MTGKSLPLSDVDRKRHDRIVQVIALRRRRRQLARIALRRRA